MKFILCKRAQLIATTAVESQSIPSTAMAVILFVNRRSPRGSLRHFAQCVVSSWLSGKGKVSRMPWPPTRHGKETVTLRSPITFGVALPRSIRRVDRARSRRRCGPGAADTVVGRPLAADNRIRGGRPWHRCRYELPATGRCLAQSGERIQGMPPTVASDQVRTSESPCSPMTYA